MRKLVQTIAVIAGLFFSIAVAGQDKASSGSKLEPLPRDLEIQLALSALPPHLRDNATVYVLNPEKGFEVARRARTVSMPLLLELVTTLSGGRGH